MKNEIKSVKDFIPKQEPDSVDLDKYIAAHRFNINKPPNDDDNILFIQDVPIGSRENIITITGRSKSRKTVAASAIATSFFRADEHLGFTSTLGDLPILHIDTEQGYRHYYHSVKRIFDDAGIQVPDRFTSIQTRDADIPLRLQLIEYLMTLLKPAVLIIDGVTDLVYDINDQREATELGTQILKWGTNFNTLIIVVIHTTKTTGFMTGSIGTYLEKKSQTVIKVELDEDDRMVSHLSCQFSRDKPFHDFSIIADEEGKYSILAESQVGTKGRGGDKSPQLYVSSIHAQILDSLFRLPTAINHKEFPKLISKAFGQVTTDTITITQAKEFQKHWLMQMWIANDADGNFIRGTNEPEGIPKPKQPELFNDDLPF